MGAGGEVLLPVSYSPLPSSKSSSSSRTSRLARSVVISVAIIVLLVAFAYIFSTAFGFNCFDSKKHPSYFCSSSSKHHHNHDNNDNNDDEHHRHQHHDVRAPAPPSVPDYLSDPFAIEFYNLSLVHLPINFANASFWLDNVNFYERTDTVQKLYGALYNISSIATPTSTYDSINGLCRPATGGYQNIFVWLPFSTYNSTETMTQFNGRTISCDWFVFSAPTSVLRLCVNGSNFIRFESLSSTQTIIVDFSPSFSTEPFNSSVFNINPQCFQNITCSQGPVEAIEVYNFHGADVFTLNNTNVADLPGDANFFCTAVVSEAYPYFEWISQWQLQVNTTWGEYAFCNFGTCLMGDERLVGREAANGFGAPLAGQCVDNGLIGTWYSLPTASACSPSQYVGDGGCTWKVLERSKTINASCLLEQGIASVCQEEIQNIPFIGAQKIFEAAFLSDDPSEGGCPPIDPETISMTTLRSQTRNYPSHLTTTKLIPPFTRSQKL